MAAYCQVYGVIHFTSPVGWLPVHRDLLRAHRSVTSMGKLYLFTCKSLCLKLPTQLMVRLDTDPLQMLEDADSISGGSKNVWVCTSLVNCDGLYHEPPRSQPYCVINERVVVADLRSLHYTVKVWMYIMHVNFDFPFKLGPKVGLCIIHKCVL